MSPTTKGDQFLPKDIFKYMSAKTLGQDDVLRKVAVAVYKHINGIRAGNILLIGSSGTGKTTIMNTIQKFYSDYKELKKFKVMTIMNANMLSGEEQGDVNLHRLVKSLEVAVNNTFGLYITERKLQEYMENATVCIDEVDKIAAMISGKANVSGLAIQHALLTLIEGEKVLLETTRTIDGKKNQLKLPIDTSGMLFICGGAFEGLYDQIHRKIVEGVDDRSFKVVAEQGADGKVRHVEKLVIKDQLRLADLFEYGMAPQFISRFRTLAVLEDLGLNELKQIMISSDDSPLRHAMEYFKSMGIDLQLTKDALDHICRHAVENTRIGARALREVFGRVVALFEFDPFGSGELKKSGNGHVLRIDKSIVREVMGK